MSKLLPMLDPFDEIKRIYFSTTKQTIERDMARVLELLTRMPSDEARQRVAGFMHGLADLKREWKPRTKQPGTKTPVLGSKAGAGKTPSQGAGTPRRPG